MSIGFLTASEVLLFPEIIVIATGVSPNTSDTDLFCELKEGLPPLRASTFVVILENFGYSASESDLSSSTIVSYKALSSG